MVWTYEAIHKVWGKRVENKSDEVALDQQGRLVLRGVTGAVKSTPTVALGALLGVGLLRNSMFPCCQSILTDQTYIRNLAFEERPKS